ncbi:polyprenyl synthetase family protein [Antrihabitans sp. YC2-6]|nr:polyprenyl synthetase family protein [Antrihabitans sp. YC2-6]
MDFRPAGQARSLRAINAAFRSTAHGRLFEKAAYSRVEIAGREQCDAERVDGWRDFGRTLGVLRQIVNDQRDIVTERDEDLRNGTATYLLVHALRAATPERRAELLRLSSQAGRSADARRMLREALLAPGVIDSYAESLRPLIARTHTLLDSFGGESSCNAELHALIDQTVGWFPQFRLG